MIVYKYTYSNYNGQSYAIVKSLIRIIKSRNFWPGTNFSTLVGYNLILLVILILTYNIYKNVF